MHPVQFKFIFPEKEGTARLARFLEPPTWEELAARVQHIYDIPAADVGISYIDSEGDAITISSNEELQEYYTTIPLVPNHPLKFSVRNLRPKRPLRPPTDILLNLDEQWTPLPVFSAVPLTPSQMHHSGAHIEEVDEDDEPKLNKHENFDDDDAESYLNIPAHEREDGDDDASSIDSILDNDLPDKQPIHVFGFPEKSPKPASTRSLSRSSTKSGSVAESRSISSTDPDRTHRMDAQFDMLVPEQLRTPSSGHSGFDLINNGPVAESHLVDPIRDRSRSRSRSPVIHNHTIPSREPYVGRSPAQSSRVLSEHPSPVIPTIETTSPRGVPASVDMRSIPSPEPIVISVPPIPEESMLFQETNMTNMTNPDPDPPLPTLPPASASSATATITTTPSLTSDIALLLDSLTRAFSEHPELSEGLRNIVRNASQGVYWNNATDAIRSIRDTVVSDALQARDVILNESTMSPRDISSQAQAEAGRKIAEALGNVFRSLGTVLGSGTSTTPSEAASARSAAPASTQAQTRTQQQEESRPYRSFLGAPGAESPALIKATPLIHGQDIPPDARSLSRPSSRSSSPDGDTNLYHSGSARVSHREGEKYGYAAPPFMPVVWAPPPPRGRNGDRNPYDPPPSIPVMPPSMPPYTFNRHRHQRSRSGAAGPAYPPPPGPPPSGAYFTSAYSASPYGYSRYPPPPPDPRVYMDPRDYGRNYNRDYSRDGYPGIGAGTNMRRSNTLPPSFTAPPAAAQPPAVAALETPYPPAGLVSPKSAPPPVVPYVAAPPVTPSFSTVAPTTQTPESSAVVVPPALATSKGSPVTDKYIELEEIKRIYKEKKEEYRKQREEKKLQKEKERAERHAEREAKRQARLLASSARARPAPQPRAAALKPAPGALSGYSNVSGSDSATEKAPSISLQRGAAGPVTSTPPRAPHSPTARLHKEVHERLNTMGFTTRSYPQLNTLVPLHIRKHTMLSKGEVPDEIIIQNVLEDIFTAPHPPSSSSNKI